MGRLDTERQAELEPARRAIAIYEIEKLGYEMEHVGDTEIEFYFKGKLVKFFPYSGWATGATIKDGRGLQNLLNQIKP